MTDQIESHVRRLEEANRPAIDRGLIFEFTPGSAGGPAAYEALIKSELDKQLKKYDYNEVTRQQYLDNKVKVIQRSLSEFGL